MRRLHLEGNFCAHQCVECSEWSWWKPTLFGGGGTGGKVDRVETEASERDDETSGLKRLPVLSSGACESCDD
jgi:hypothetical protein